MTIDTTNNTSLTTLDLDAGFGDDNVGVMKPTLQPNPSLRYMSGNLMSDTGERVVGWHVPAGVNPDLDELLSARGTKRYIVEHKTGEEKEKPYWNLSAGGQPISLFVIAYGINSTWQMNKNLADRTGIAYGVGVVTEKDGTPVINLKTGKPKKKVQLHLRCFIQELLNPQVPEQGFNEWFELSLSNFMIDELLAALHQQFRVIDAYDGIMKARGKPNRAQFWSFSIPMEVGKKKDVGTGEKDDEHSTIFPMVAKIPDLPLNSQATIDYLNAHRIPLHLQGRLRDGGLLDETYLWSLQLSEKIVTGQKDPSMSTTVTEEPVDGSVVVLPQMPPTADPLVTPEQITWIRSTYCGNNEGNVKAICAHFKVQDLAELHLSQYTQMVAMVKR